MYSLRSDLKTVIPLRRKIFTVASHVSMTYNPIPQRLFTKVTKTTTRVVKMYKTIITASYINYPYIVHGKLGFSDTTTSDLKNLCNQHSFIFVTPYIHSIPDICIQNSQLNKN